MTAHDTDRAEGALAIVGSACRFPGASDLDAYWDLLRTGREGLTRFTDADLDERGVPAAMRARPGYLPVGGLIADQDRFDPAPFGLTDAEAALLDPQHRLFLQAAWHALEHAGHGGGRVAGSVGVFAGSMQSAYLASNLAGRWDPTGAGPDPLGSLATAMATQPDYLPLQVAYRLDLTGPAVAVATSCSTSLVAVHLAAQSLLSGECDTALAGGVSLIVPQGQGYLHVPDGVFSADGRVCPFGAAGTGIVYTQGVGVVVLRRLADALASGDDVLAVLHGSAVNNDGADKAGFTAPSVRGQARAVAEALAVARVEPTQVGLLEAHGTATPLGDPIELAALRRVFGDGPAWCGLGSVKGNIGHADSAAGVASLIKAVLAVRHRTLPATLHAEPVNPALALDGSPFALLTATRPWDTPPYAGVSSFGIGGTNAHVVLGPAPQRPSRMPDHDRRCWWSRRPPPTPRGRRPPRSPAPCPRTGSPTPPTPWRPDGTSCRTGSPGSERPACAPRASSAPGHRAWSSRSPGPAARTRGWAGGCTAPSPCSPPPSTSAPSCSPRTWARTFATRWTPTARPIGSPTPGWGWPRCSRCATGWHGCSRRGALGPMRWSGTASASVSRPR